MIVNLERRSDMPQIINTNISSLNAQRNLNNSQNAQSQALERLSSGLRINGAKDDAAGLAISNRLDAQVRGLNVANRNAGDGVSLAQTAEGALNSITGSLQRMRELALQSANGSNSSLERSSIQEEVEQLKAEIASISEKTSFNGQNLLDGSFQNTGFQTGANVGERIDVSIGETSVNTLGSAATAGISSNVSQDPLTTTGTDALVAGDLVINGIAVGASSGTADTSSTGYGSSSAISKAAAINAVSDASGVQATANVNTAKGNVVLDGAAAITVAVPVDINGQEFSLTKGATGDAVADLASVAATINEKSGATGVIATVVAMDTGARIDLSAEDGRNISIVGDPTTFGMATGTGTGGASAAVTTGNTYTGDITLSSIDGSDFTLTTNTGDIDNAGFEAGKFSGQQGGAVSDNVTAATALAAGDITINGVSVGVSKASDDNASTVTNEGSAIAKAAAINNISDQTGVTATANANSVVGTAVSAVAATAVLTLNDVDISITTTTDAVANQATIVDAINAKSGQTGITASIIDSDKLNLVAADGRTIAIGGAVGSTGLSVANTASSITLSSAGSFEIGTKTGSNAVAGLNVGKFGGTETGTLLKDIDVSTLEGAEAAIAGIDNAINQVASEQAKLGALQNRFESTISNNAVNSESLSAANSRIRDADFAVETAALSRAQVLQQAGISVLAQANARPQQVLSLLQ
jgi:flagellin